MIGIIFKLGFKYKANDDNGKEKTFKQEFLAECLNYTEAEKLAMKIIEEYEMNKIETCSYDIKKLPNANNILYNDNFTVDENCYKTEKVVSLYFEKDNQNLYQVDIKLSGDDSTSKETYYVPATSTNKAVTAVLDLFRDNFLTATVQKTSTLELVDSVFVYPSTYDDMRNASK